jgi:NAD(P)-dependent dehydrogenase (short-subunit alcohol dehydrogenase family)
MLSVAGNHAFVCGAGSGIGRATAIALAHAGGQVYLADWSEESAAATSAELGNAPYCAVNMADAAAVDNVMQRLARNTGVLLPGQFRRHLYQP